MDKQQAACLTRDLLSSYDPADAFKTAQSLREIWLRAAPATSLLLPSGQQAFVRDWGIRQADFAAAGTPVPILTAMGDELGYLGRRRVLEFLPLARLLWDKYGREGRLVAVVALGPMELSAPETVVPVLHDMARTCVFWEDCDQLAMKALEPVLRREPQAWLDRLAAWVRDDNKWVRRAGLTAIGRLPMKKTDYTWCCVDLIAPALGDADADVKRALSFALRVCARGATAPVRQFVWDHRTARDGDSLWVLCDVVRSMTKSLLPEFVELLPVYRAWLDVAEPQARRSIAAAIGLLEGVAAG